MDRYNDDGVLDPDGIYDENGDEIPADVLTKEKNREGFQLRKANNQIKTLTEQLAAISRERAFEKAGIDPADAKFTYFVKGYDGELTPEAVKAEAVKIGLLEAEVVSDPLTDPANAAALAAQQKIADASAGAGTPQTGIQALQQEQLDAWKSGDGNNTAALLQVLAKQGIPIAETG